jgi:hypothetical protein
VRPSDGKFDGLAEVSLDEPKPEREKNVCAEQKNQQRWSPDKIAELSDKFLEFLGKAPRLRGKNYRVVLAKAKEKMPPRKKLDAIVATCAIAFDSDANTVRSEAQRADQFGCMISRTKTFSCPSSCLRTSVIS